MSRPPYGIGDIVNYRNSSYHNFSDLYVGEVISEVIIDAAIGPLMSIRILKAPRTGVIGSKIHKLLHNLQLVRRAQPTESYSLRELIK